METGRSRGCWITARRGDLGVLIRGGYRGGGGEKEEGTITHANRTNCGGTKV